MKGSARRPRPLSPRERADHAAWLLDDILATYAADSDITRVVSPAIWQLVDLAKSRSRNGISKYEQGFAAHA